ncbi:MAG: pentapeptide repeat-containing protein, partial [Candidatus Brocadiales bacterium]|nr:pentapeptide repeat-containing protein [Candidatus Brocadiales bacterium]
MSDQKCQWKSKLSPDYECLEVAKLPDEDQHWYCILHSREEDKDREGNFTKAVEDRLHTRDGKINLRGCYFPTTFNSNYFLHFSFKKPIDFGEAAFFQKADFKEAIFSQYVDFRKGTFLQEADFHKAKFLYG